MKDVKDQEDGELLVNIKKYTIIILVHPDSVKIKKYLKDRLACEEEFRKRYGLDEGGSIIYESCEVPNKGTVRT